MAIIVPLIRSDTFVKTGISFGMGDPRPPASATLIGSLHPSKADAAEMDVNHDPVQIDEPSSEFHGYWWAHWETYHTSPTIQFDWDKCEYDDVPDAVVDGIAEVFSDD